MPSGKRNYRREYDEYQGKPEQRKRRSERNKARRKMEKVGKVHKGDGKDVDHKDRNTSHNSKSNLRVESKHKNRSYSRKGEKGHGPKKNHKR